MATMQTKFTDEDRAIVRKVPEAMNKAAASEKYRYATKCSVYTRGFMWNCVANTALKLYDHHIWAGFRGSYPDVLNWSEQSHQKFKCRGYVPRGSKAGVMYTDPLEPEARKLVVAFDDMKKKVYVEAGPIGPTDWKALNTEGADCLCFSLTSYVHAYRL